MSDRLGIPERHEDAPAISQQFAGMPVGRRQHRLAAAEGIGQRARRDLVFVEVRRDVDVGGADESEQFRHVDEAVVKDHVLRHAEIVGQLLELFPVAFALLTQQMRVGGSQHHVACGGMLRYHGRQRPDHVLDALVGREQAECEEHVFACHAEAILVEIRIDELHVGNAVGDHVDPVVGDAVDLAEQRAAALRHDGQPGREMEDIAHHPPLIGRGMGENGMERGVDRCPDVAHQFEHVSAGGAAEDAVFVLQGDDVDVREIQELGGPLVGRHVGVGALEPHLGGILVGSSAVVHRHDETIGLREVGSDGVAHVAGERGDAATARGVVADEGDAVENAAGGGGSHGASGSKQPACLPRNPAKK